MTRAKRQPKSARPRNIASIRRDEVVSAAVRIIVEQGLENLSLSAIEEEAGMSRGQLTYYFPHKETILLAVFDQLLMRMYERIGPPEGADPGRNGDLGTAEIAKHLLRTILERPAVSPEFDTLQYTFLSQIGHRDDYRRKLAGLYKEWRTHMARGLPRGAGASPRTVASLVQAVLHGLSVQLAADPAAFDRAEMLNYCLDLLGPSLKPPARSTTRKPTRRGKRPPSEGR